MTIVDLLDRLESSSEVIRTPSGNGHIIWHQWGKGVPLVLLHGGSGAWNHWIMNIEELSQYYQLLVPDIPGLGDSDDPPFHFQAGNYHISVPKLAGVIFLGLKSILGHKSFHLCGFSFGSIVGSYMGAKAGKQLLTFTLVGASAFGWRWGGLKSPFLSMAPKMNEAECLEVQRANLANAMLTSTVSKDLARLQLKNVRRARLRSHMVTETNVMIPGLSAVKAPLNGIWGSEDVFAQPNLKRIEQLLGCLDPNSQFKIIHGAGHWAMLDAPETFNSLLIEMLEPRG